jgi:hypothetical protein
MRRPRAFRVALLAGALSASARAQSTNEVSTECIPPEQRARLEAVIAEYERRVPGIAQAGSPPQLFPSIRRRGRCSKTCS